jgi:pimeloyl-ACP methyl ester carboxylesterase
MPHINFENSAIHYEVRGQGEPILLLHGLLENSSMWDGYAKELSSTCQVIRIDLPGHGNSESLSIHSMDKMAEAVLNVLDFLNVAQVKIVGHSMGGYVALALANKAPQIASAILLFFSSAAADTPEKRENRDRLKAIVSKDKESFMRHAIPMLFTKETRQVFASELEDLIKDAQALGTSGIVKTLDGLKTRPDRQHILKSAIPISFVSGKLDEAISLSSLIKQHSAKAVKKVWLTENGHMGHIEDRDFCLVAIREFIA